MRAKVRGAARAKERRAANARRRAAMFWMLREAGASYVEIAPAAGLSRSRVHQICQSYAYQLHRRSEYVTGKEPFMERLRRAGALLGAAEREGGLLVEQRFEPRSSAVAASTPPPGWPRPTGGVHPDGARPPPPPALRSDP
jgi:hypothetical protein